jgi:DNA-binding MarR family transcriptional regulator
MLYNAEYINAWNGKVVEDIVRALGFLPLGSRFRRIGERLQADTQRIMEEMGAPLQAGQHPFLAAIDRHGPLAIGEIAEAVGITQPGATRAVKELVELGLLRAEQAPDDQRRKVISLTVAGQDLVDEAKRTVWPRIHDAVEDLCAGLTGPLLDQLAAIEDGLAEKPLNRRANGKSRP